MLDLSSIKWQTTRHPGVFIHFLRRISDENSIHHPVALDGAEDCIMFAVAHRGIEFI